MGRFLFPLEHVSGQLRLVVLASGLEPAINEEIFAVKGQATQVEVQMVPRW